MKYFKVDNEIMAIDEGQEFLIKPEWLEITEEEAMLITNPPKTQEELEADRIASVKAKSGEIIYSRYSIEKQSSANLGIYGGEYLDNMKAFIADIIKQSNKLEADVSKTADDFIIPTIGVQ